MKIEVLHPISHGVKEDGVNVVKRFGRGLHDVDKDTGALFLSLRDTNVPGAVSHKEFEELQDDAQDGDRDAYERLAKVGAIARPYVPPPAPRNGAVDVKADKSKAGAAADDKGKKGAETSTATPAK